jgi:hypothetical protein
MARRRRSKRRNEPQGFDLERAIRDVAQMQMATAHVPAIVAQEVRKAWKQLPNTDPSRGPKSWFHDPLSLQYSLGYKDRRFALTYETLKRIAGQLSVISSIINTRAAQVAAFSQPYRWTKSLGFVVRHKDPDHATTPAETAFIKELEEFVLRCGRREQNPFSRVPRDDFEMFLRKIVRDSLIFDQACFEVVPDRLGLPFEFLAVDSSTIRLAADDRYIGVNTSYHQRNGFVPDMPTRFANLYEGRTYGVESGGEAPVSFVQVVNGQIENVYSHDNMAFGVRNPRTDIYIQGYGFGELEQLITIVTSHLYAEEYNRKFFSQGSAPKGMLNLKGDNYTPEMLEGFRRQWAAQAQGVENSWRTPIMQSEGIEWIDLNKSNAEMEFGKWMEYLIKISCGVFLIDPAEINFDLHGGQSQKPMFESSQEWKLKASRDRGLKPLLRFLAKLINRNIIDKIDDHFTLEFVGLDELSETEKHEMLVEQIASYMTLNEARRTLDLPDLEGGDIPMNPVYIQAMEKMQGGGDEGGGDGGGGGGAPGGDKGDDDKDSKGGPGDKGPQTAGAGGGGPKYSEHFGLNLGEKVGT